MATLCSQPAKTAAIREMSAGNASQPARAQGRHQTALPRDSVRQLPPAGELTRARKPRPKRPSRPEPPAPDK